VPCNRISVSVLVTDVLLLDAKRLHLRPRPAALYPVDHGTLAQCSFAPTSATRHRQPVCPPSSTSSARTPFS
jgi:hypothetical protein